MKQTIVGSISYSSASVVGSVGVDLTSCQGNSIWNSTIIRVVVLPFRVTSMLQVFFIYVTFIIFLWLQRVKVIIFVVCLKGWTASIQQSLHFARSHHWYGEHYCPHLGSKKVSHWYDCSCSHTCSWYQHYCSHLSDCMHCCCYCVWSTDHCSDSHHVGEWSCHHGLLWVLCPWTVCVVIYETAWKTLLSLNEVMSGLTMWRNWEDTMFSCFLFFARLCRHYRKPHGKTGVQTFGLIIFMLKKANVERAWDELWWPVFSASTISSDLPSAAGKLAFVLFYWPFSAMIFPFSAMIFPWWRIRRMRRSRREVYFPGILTFMRFVSPYNKGRSQDSRLADDPVGSPDSSIRTREKALWFTEVKGWIQ